MVLRGGWPAPLTHIVRGIEAMSKRTIALSLGVLAAGVLFALGLAATKPLPIRVGMIIQDPGIYFRQQVDAEEKAQHPFRAFMFPSEDGGTWVCTERGFTVLGDHWVATRISSYRFDTNGVVVSIGSRWKWPIFRL